MSKHVVDTWTPEGAAKLSIFREWEIVHEVKSDSDLNILREPIPISLREEIHRALYPSDEEENDEDEIDQNTMLPRRDPTLQRAKKTPDEPPKFQHEPPKCPDDPMMLKKEKMFRRDLLRRMSKESCHTDSSWGRDTDSGVERDLAQTEDDFESCSEWGAPTYQTTASQNYSPSVTSTTQDYSDCDWDSQSCVGSSASPSPAVSTNNLSTTSKSGRVLISPHENNNSKITDRSSTPSPDARRRKVGPKWDEPLPELEPISLSIENQLGDAKERVNAVLDSMTVAAACSEVQRKVLVIGDSGVGKSSFVRRFVARMYSRQYQPTVGVDFALKLLQYSDNVKVRLQLWDIAGQERFTTLTRVYYKDAHACIIMFDLTQKSTFANAARWKQDLDEKCTLADGKPIPCMLLANKCDLKGQREVDQEQIEQFSSKHQFVAWTETSVKTGCMVDESMKYLVDELMKTFSQVPMPETNNNILLKPEENEEENEASKCSC